MLDGEESASRARRWSLASAADWLARLAVSAIVVLFLWQIARITKFWNSGNEAAPLAQRPGFSPVRRKSLAEERTAVQLWPKFPLRVRPAARKIVMSGIPCQIETFETPMNGREVLDFYKQQMAPLGWRDTTEETYNVQPETRERRRGDLALQRPSFVESYRFIADSRLVLNRDGWTVQICTEAKSQNLPQTTVAIVASPTSSAAEFASRLTAGPGPGQSGQPVNKVEFEEKSGGQKYKTVVSQNPKLPLAAFQAELARLSQQGWHQVFTSSPRKNTAGYFSLLVNGRRSAALSSAAARQGPGASVIFTEITPE